MKHTKGPWKTCNGGKCSCFMVSGSDHPIATVEHGEWGDEYPSIRLVGPSLDRKAEAYMDIIGYGNIPEEEAKANARLIAAAPELLEACHRMTSAFHPTHGESDIGCDMAMASAFAAIAKADG